MASPASTIKQIKRLSQTKLGSRLKEAAKVVGELPIVRSVGRGMEAGAGQGRFAQSVIIDGLGQVPKDVANPIAYRAGQIAQDQIGMGTRSRTMFDLHPLDFTSGRTYNAVRRLTNAPNAAAQATAAATATTLALVGNNGVIGRPAGFQSLTPGQREADPTGRFPGGVVDETKVTNPVIEGIRRGFLGNTGRLLSFEDYLKDRPDVRQKYGLGDTNNLQLVTTGATGTEGGLLSEDEFLSQNSDYVDRVGEDAARQQYQKVFSTYKDYANYQEFLGKPLSPSDYKLIKGINPYDSDGAKLEYNNYRDRVGNASQIGGGMGFGWGLVKAIGPNIESPLGEARIMGYRVKPEAAAAAAAVAGGSIALLRQKYGAAPTDRPEAADFRGPDSVDPRAKQAAKAMQTPATPEQAAYKGNAKPTDPTPPTLDEYIAKKAKQRERAASTTVGSGERTTYSAKTKKQPKPLNQLPDTTDPQFVAEQLQQARASGDTAAAAGWEKQAKTLRQSALQTDVQAMGQSQTSLFGATEYASDMPLFGQSPTADPTPPPVSRQVSPTAAPQPEFQPSNIYQVDPNQLNLDPERFQYKLNPGKGGSTGSIQGTAWNPKAGGIVQAWRDPADGKIYVVNGHNRTEFAQRLNAANPGSVPAINVELIDNSVFRTAEEARSYGAIANIAEGRGTAFDAAKYIRDAGPGAMEELRSTVGKSKLLGEGQALANLEPNLFQKALTGELPREHAIAIGSELPDQSLQGSLLEDLKGVRNPNAETVRQLAIEKRLTSTETQASLFGDVAVPLSKERARVAAYIQGRLNETGTVARVGSQSRKAGILQQIGDNSLDVAANAQAAERIGKARSNFDAFRTQPGQVNDFLNRAAQRLASGENLKAIGDELFNEALGFGDRSLKEMSASANTTKPKPASNPPTAEPTPKPIKRGKAVSPANAGSSAANTGTTATVDRVGSSQVGAGLEAPKPIGKGKGVSPNSTQLPPTSTQLPPTSTQRPPTSTQPRRLVDVGGEMRPAPTMGKGPSVADVLAQSGGTTAPTARPLPPAPKPAPAPLTQTTPPTPPPKKPTTTAAPSTPPPSGEGGIRLWTQADTERLRAQIPQKPELSYAEAMEQADLSGQFDRRRSVLVAERYQVATGMREGTAAIDRQRLDEVATSNRRFERGVDQAVARGIEPAPMYNPTMAPEPGAPPKPAELPTPKPLGGSRPYSAKPQLLINPESSPTRSIAQRMQALGARQAAPPKPAPITSTQSTSIVPYEPKAPARLPDPQPRSLATVADAAAPAAQATAKPAGRLARLGQQAGKVLRPLGQIADRFLGGLDTALEIRDIDANQQIAQGKETVSGGIARGVVAPVSSISQLAPMGAQLASRFADAGGSVPNMVARGIGEALGVVKPSATTQRVDRKAAQVSEALSPTKIVDRILPGRQQQIRQQQQAIAQQEATATTAERKFQGAAATNRQLSSQIDKAEARRRLGLAPGAFISNKEMRQAIQMGAKPAPLPKPAPARSSNPSVARAQAAADKLDAEMRQQQAPQPQQPKAMPQQQAPKPRPIGQTAPKPQGQPPTTRPITVDQSQRTQGGGSTATQSQGQASGRAVSYSDLIGSDGKPTAMGARLKTTVGAIGFSKMVADAAKGGGSGDRLQIARETNTSREGIATQGNQTRLQIAGQNNQTRIDVAGMNNVSREKIADLTSGRRLQGTRETNVSREKIAELTSGRRLQGTVYTADQRLRGTVYTADQRRAGTEYSADRRFQGQMYQSDRRLQGDQVRASATMGAASVKADAQRFAAEEGARSRQNVAAMSATAQQFASQDRALAQIAATNDKENERRNRLQLAAMSAASSQSQSRDRNVFSFRSQRYY